MEIKINIQETRNLLKDFNVPYSYRRELSNMIRTRLLHETHKNIVTIANSELNSSRSQYLNGLSILPNKIVLSGWLANAVEDGVGAIDLKAGFMRASNVRYKKDGGWYTTIPFRIFTPNSSNNNHTQMTWRIYRAVMAGKKYDAGQVKTRPSFTDSLTNVSYSSYTHKSPILQGIKKTENSSGRSSYRTFRRVSDKSDPMSWIHKGINAHRIFDRAWEKVDITDIIKSTINQYL